MSELRLNILDGNWIVLAPERGKKPESFKVDRGTDIRNLPEYDENCPFCAGNEKRFDIVPLRETRNADDKLTARLIENKYKIFDNHANCPVTPEPFTQHGVHFYYKGCGNHYLVLENPLHNRVLGMLADDEVRDVFMLYKEAFTRLSHNPNNLEHDILRKEYKEPRLHMALVCAAKGCPPLRNEAYVAEKLNDQLNDQSKVYLTSPHGLQIDRAKGEARISSIFKWYGKDFTSVTDFIEKHSGKSLKGLKIHYINYDWSLNKKG